MEACVDQGGLMSMSHACVSHAVRCVVSHGKEGAMIFFLSREQSSQSVCALGGNPLGVRSL